MIEFKVELFLSDQILDYMNVYRVEKQHQPRIVKMNSQTYEKLVDELNENELTLKDKSYSRKFCGVDIIVDDTIKKGVIIFGVFQ